MPNNAQYEANAEYILESGFEVDPCIPCARLLAKNDEDFEGCWMLSIHDPRRQGARGLRKCHHCTGKRLNCSNKDKDPVTLGLNIPNIDDDQPLRPVQQSWPRPTRTRWFLETADPAPSHNDATGRSSEPSDNEDLDMEAIPASETEEGLLNESESSSSSDTMSTPVLRAPPVVLSVTASPQVAQSSPALRATSPTRPTTPPAPPARSPAVPRPPVTLPGVSALPFTPAGPATSALPSFPLLPTPVASATSALPPMPQYAHHEAPGVVNLNPSFHLPIFFLPETREGRQGALRLFSTEELIESLYWRTRYQNR